MITTTKPSRKIMKTLTYFLEDSLNLDNILIAINSDNQVVFVSLDNTKEDNIYNLKKEYPNFKIEEGILNDNIREIFNHVKNPVVPHSVKIHMDGSDFQMNVWKAIMNIPTGKTASYTEIAETIGKPQSVRAVATACSKNKIAVLVPCHRVVSKSDKNTGYRWDVFRKKRLLDIEKEKQF